MCCSPGRAPVDCRRRSARRCLRPPVPPRDRVAGAAGRPSRRRSGPGTAEPVTHLDVLLHAVTAAAVAWPSPRKPWREMLPEELDWFGIDRPAHASAPGRRGRYLTLGMLDDPAAQAQHAATFDLKDGGGLIIGGSGGSGKTTAMRTARCRRSSGRHPTR